MSIIRGYFITDNQIDDLILDVATTVEHAFGAEVTDHPVSRGESVSDHIIPQADGVTFNGVISRTPINARIITSEDVFTRYTRAFEKLRDLIAKPRLITLHTIRRTYTSMVATSINITDDASTGDSIQFVASFRHIRQVQTQVTAFSDAAQRPNTIPAVKRLGQQSPTKLPNGTNVGGLVPIL